LIAALIMLAESSDRGCVFLQNDGGDRAVVRNEVRSRKQVVGERNGSCRGHGPACATVAQWASFGMEPLLL